MNDGEGINQKNTYAQSMDMDNNIGMSLGWGRGGAWWRWGEGEKLGKTVTACTIQIKLKKREDTRFKWRR